MLIQNMQQKYTGSFQQFRRENMYGCSRENMASVVGKTCRWNYYCVVRFLLFHESYRSPNVTY
jgi:hypothetical protein